MFSEDLDVSDVLKGNCIYQQHTLHLYVYPVTHQDRHDGEQKHSYQYIFSFYYV